MRYNGVRLEKGMYQEHGRTFSHVLESIDPSNQYVGTPLEGLDAFQRQLKRFDIKVKGAQSDTVEKFFATTESAVLFPEYVARVVQRGMEESDIVPMITASVTRVDDEEQVGNTRANLRKRGRLLVSGYDAVRAQKLDLFSVTLRQIGSYIAHTRLEDAVDVLVNGDCNSKAAEVASLNGRIFGYNTLLDFWAQFDPYEMNIALASNDVALDLLKMPEFQNPSAGFSFQQPHCVTMPFGPMLIRSNAVPQNTVIGIDKCFALEMGQVGDVTTEYDKLINRQFERTAITIISGFSKIYDEASRVLSTSLQKKR